MVVREPRAELLPHAWCGGVALRGVMVGLALVIGGVMSGWLAPVASAEEQPAPAAGPLTIIDGALIASGHRDPCARATLVERFALLAEAARAEQPLLASNGQPLPPADVALKLLQQLHQQLLVGRYDAKTTDIQTTIDRGDFNCVSATILLVALARSQQVELEVISLKGHVLARLKHDPAVLLETTIKPQSQLISLPMTLASRGDASAGKSGLVAGESNAAEEAETKLWRTLTDDQLIAKIHYNQAIMHLADGRYERALESLKISRQLDPDDQDALENQLATFNNWGLQLVREGEFETSLTRIHEGLAIAPRYTPLLANELHVIRAWVLKLSSEGKTEQALAILRAGAARRPDEPLFTIGIEQLSTPAPAQQ